MLAVKVGKAPIQIWPGLIVFDLVLPFIRVGVEGTRECVVDVGHHVLTEPLGQASLEGVVNRVAVRVQRIGALVLVQAQQPPAQFLCDGTVPGIVEHVAGGCSRVNEIVVGVYRKVVPKEAASWHACPRQEANGIDIERLVGVDRLQQLSSLGSHIADLKKPIRLEFPLCGEVPLLGIGRRELGRNHLRLERFEFVVRVKVSHEDRLSVVKTDPHRRNGQAPDILREAVPVALVVQLKLAEKGRRLAKRIGKTAGDAFVEHPIPAPQAPACCSPQATRQTQSAA